MSILPVERHDIYIARKVINHTERRPETRHQTFQAPNSSPEMSTEILDLKKKEKRKEMPGHTNNNFEICYALASYVNSKYCPAMETGSIENG